MQVDSGMSIQDVKAIIEADTGIPSHQQTLISGGIVLRPHARKPRKKYDWSQKNYIWPKPAIRNAPFGYFLSKGILKADSREQEVIQIILELWKNGKSHGAIARELNNQNIKPRKAKKWSQVIVGFIIKRQGKL
jgi:hypothetical protein